MHFAVIAKFAIIAAFLKVAGASPNALEARQACLSTCTALNQTCPTCPNTTCRGFELLPNISLGVSRSIYT